MSQRLTGTLLYANQNIGWLKQNKLRIATLTTATAVFFSTLAPAGIAVAGTKTVVTNNDYTVTKTEINNALKSVPGILNSSDQITTKSDGDSAATTNINGSVVDVPKDAENGVTFGASGGPKLKIELPNAEEASSAKSVAPGVVGYDSGNGSANAVQPTEDGGVRMLTIIDNPDAPTEYDYKINVPSEGRILLVPDGSAFILTKNGRIFSSISAPWAKDAKGRSIETWFTTDGKILTQHAKHNVNRIVYPILADPRFNWKWTGVDIYFNRSESRFLSGLSLSVLAGVFTAMSGMPVASGAVSGAAYTADWVVSRSGYCLAIWKGYFSIYQFLAWAYRC